MSNLIQFFRGNLVLVFISVLLSWMIWFQVRTQLVGEVELEATVVIIVPGNVRELDIENRPKTIKLKVHGPRDRIAALGDIQASGSLEVTFTVPSGIVDETIATQKIDFKPAQARLSFTTAAGLVVEEMDDLRVHFAVWETKSVPAFVGIASDIITNLEKSPSGLPPTSVRSKRDVTISGPAALLRKIDTVSAGKTDEKDVLPEGDKLARNDVEFVVVGLPDRVTARSTAVFDFKFEVVNERTVEVVIEVHWIFGHDDDPKVIIDETPIKIDTADPNVLKVGNIQTFKVRIKSTSGKITDEQVKTIRAYIRSDEALASGEGKSRVTDVHFADLPDAWTVVSETRVSFSSDE